MLSSIGLYDKWCRMIEKEPEIGARQLNYIVGSYMGNCVEKECLDTMRKYNLETMSG